MKAFLLELFFFSKKTRSFDCRQGQQQNFWTFSLPAVVSVNCNEELVILALALHVPMIIPPKHNFPKNSVMSVPLGTSGPEVFGVQCWDHNPAEFQLRIPTSVPALHAQQFLRIVGEAVEVWVICFAGYQISWEVYGRNESRLARSLSNSTLEFKITGLSSLTTYTIEVAAVTAQGSGAVTSSTISSGVPPGWSQPAGNKQNKTKQNMLGLRVSVLQRSQGTSVRRW